MNAPRAAIGRQIDVLSATTNLEIDAAFASLAQKRTDALLVAPQILFSTRRVQLITLAARHAVLTMYHQREYVEAGGLMSYGSSIMDWNAHRSCPADHSCPGD
jgi:putative ABC transport system substrate-binding protein